MTQLSGHFIEGKQSGASNSKAGADVQGLTDIHLGSIEHLWEVFQFVQHGIHCMGQSRNGDDEKDEPFSHNSHPAEKVPLSPQ